jgi:hypothetical protein
MLSDICTYYFWNMKTRMSTTRIIKIMEKMDTNL